MPMIQAVSEHTYWGPHPEISADGKPLRNGQVVTPDLDSLHDTHLIARGWLVEGAEQPDPPKRTRRNEQED